MKAIRQPTGTPFIRILFLERAAVIVPWDNSFEVALREHLRLLPSDEILLPDANLMELGLDSLGIVWLVTQLETSYNLSFPDTDMKPSTFASPAALWETVVRLRGVPTRL